MNGKNRNLTEDRNIYRMNIERLRKEIGTEDASYSRCMQDRISNLKEIYLLNGGVKRGFLTCKSVIGYDRELNPNIKESNNVDLFEWLDIGSLKKNKELMSELRDLVGSD